MRRRVCFLLLMLALSPGSTAFASHDDEDVAGVCEGYAPDDRTCTLTFVAERDIVGSGVRLWWLAGVLRAEISGGDGRMTWNCRSAVVTSGCGGTSTADGIPAGATVTIEVDAIGSGGTLSPGYWAVYAYYDAAS